MAQVRRNPKIADVLIIGAGASGSVAAKHFAEAGVSVVCLEQGPKVDNGEFWGDKPEWELMSQKRWHPESRMFAISRSDYPIDTSESDVNPADVQRRRRQRRFFMPRIGSASCLPTSA